MLDPAILIRGLPGPGVYFIYYIFIRGGASMSFRSASGEKPFAVRRARWAGAVARYGMLKGMLHRYLVVDWLV